MESVTESPVAESTTTKFLLDTNQACFLCLQKSVNSSELNAEFDIHSLGYICQYLNLSIKNLMEKIVKQENVADIPNNQYGKCESSENLLVRLCYPCTTVVSKLSSLIKQLELTNMLIDHQLQRFHDILKTSSQYLENNDSDILNNTTISEEGHGKPVQNLRAIITEKCAEEINRILESSPVVKLEKVEFQHIPKQPSPSDEYSDGEEYYVEQANSPAQSDSDSKQLQSETTNFKENTNTKEISTKILNDKPNHAIANCKSKNIFRKTYPKFFNGVGDGKRVVCKLCNQTVLRFIRDLHIVNTHPETILKQSKPIDCDQKEFQNTCKNLVCSESRLGKQPHSDTYSCQYCLHKVVSLQRHRLHLFTSHFNALRKKLKSMLESKETNQVSSVDKDINKLYFLKDGNPSSEFMLQIRQTFYSTQIENNQQKCSICSIKVYKLDLRQHLTRVHPEVIFEHLKLKNVSNEQFKICCRKLIDDESVEANTVRINHRSRYRCTYCEASFSRLHHYNYHQVMNHFEYLKKKLISLQEKPAELIESDLETDFLTKRRQIRGKTAVEIFLQQLVLENFDKHPSSEERTCKICKEKLKCINITRLHLVEKHTEKVFAEMHLESVMKENFKYCCDHLLATEIAGSIFITRPNKRSCRKCQYCETVVARPQLYLHHLVVKHFGIMEENLVRLQTEQVWREKKGEHVKITKRKQGETENEVGKDEGANKSQVQIKREKCSEEEVTVQVINVFVEKDVEMVEDFAVQKNKQSETCNDLKVEVSDTDEVNNINNEDCKEESTHKTVLIIYK